MSVKDYQVVIIGGGPGGYVAAVRCAQLGLKTACIEKNKTLGGTCLNVGCIPSKALLYASEVFSLVKEQNPNATPNFDRIMENKSGSVHMLVSSVSNLLKHHHIDQVEGTAAFIDPNTIAVTQPDGSKKNITSDYFIIATGSEPIPLPFAPFDEKTIVSSTGALSLPKIPSSLIVIGGGIIGVEIASVYQRLGSKVDIIEMLDHICPGVEPTAARTLLQILKKQGINFHLSSKVIDVKDNGNTKDVTFEEENQKQTLPSDVVLVCVGRRPYTQSLQLENAGIKTDAKGRIPVNDSLRTSQSNILAIGDVIEGPGLAHRASEEGIAVAESIAGKQKIISYLSIPNVIYTYPEVASVGLTDQEAKAKGLDIITGQVSMRGNPRARCTGELEGFVKVVGEKNSGRLIGLHIVSAHASELIAIGAIAIAAKLTVEQIAETPFAHPTYSEAIKEASLLALGRAIHA
ncbi:MAG: dihydrolipoyl dehydrogenase [Parachlamydiales bacterium]|jgi:dihydrolipoamide dehydrogenase